jgi:integrase
VARKAARGKTGARVFPGVKGEARDISKSFAALVRKLGMNEGATDRRNQIVFHTLRHTFASWLAMAGTDILRIKTLMRHKTLAMTERYAHLIPDATKAAVHNLRPPRAS